MNSFEYNGVGSGELKLSTVSTQSLREKLNRIYSAMHTHHGTFSSIGLFEYLWDLKELAILEGRQSVSVPASWLRELDDECQRAGHSAQQSSCCGSRTAIS